MGYRRYALGLEPDDEPMSRGEADNLDRAVRDWQRTGQWREEQDG